MPRTTTLSLNMPRAASPVSSAITSPAASETTSTSPQSAKHEDHMFDDKENQTNKAVEQQTMAPRMVEPPSVTVVPASTDLTSLPPYPSSPESAPKHVRDPSKSFFSNLKASKSSNRVHHVEPTIRQVPEESAAADPDLAQNTLYSVRKGTGSTPDLGKSSLGFEPQDSNTSDQTHATHRRPKGPSILSDSVLMTTQPDSLAGRTNKPRFGHLLGRTRSIRMEDGGGRRSKPATPIRITGPEEFRHYEGSLDPGGLKTAPLQHEKDRSFRDMMGSAIRNKSADRQNAGNQDQGTTSLGRVNRDPAHGLTGSASMVFRDGRGARAHLITNLKNTSTKAADGLGKAGKGILGKITRTGSHTVKEGPEEERYVCSIINLPLVEQTRRTRIAKRLADSKDKTEFWMPALPWRCIDFLNFRGCEEEGLYRVPGSGPKVREWQQRFDQEGDINLFNEEGLYDINIVGSMFKAWLRDLPTEILPKAIQAKIAQTCAGATEVPQLFKDELSNLPPWNYYLLFAITCHLSLLHAYVDKNKMNYTNLCICFQPCLKIDTFLFQFLVCDWRNCWQGCWTEKDALAEEYRVLDGIHSSGQDSLGGSTAVTEERSQSSQSSKATMSGRNQDRGRLPTLSLATGGGQRPHTPPNVHRIHKEGAHPPELAPLMPLSPIGL